MGKQGQQDVVTDRERIPRWVKQPMEKLGSSDGVLWVGHVYECSELKEWVYRMSGPLDGRAV